MSEELSKYVREARNEMMSQAMTFYHRADFLRKLNELNNGRGTSEFDSIKFQLKRMMQARGFPKDVVESLAQSNKDNLNREYFRAYIIKKVPTEKELVVVLLEFIYSLYCKFPSNERFMSRIVKRITNDAFPNDSFTIPSCSIASCFAIYVSIPFFYFYLFNTSSINLYVDKTSVPLSLIATMCS